MIMRRTLNAIPVTEPLAVASGFSAEITHSLPRAAPYPFLILSLVLAIFGSTLQSNVVAQANKGMNSTQTNTVLLPNRSPLVTFRILFMTGSAYDPKGKEGLASLTAAMLAEGGSRAKPYSEITDAMYPMATSFQWQVDKEMTVFSGSTHTDNLDKYYSLIREMLLDPGFREDDFKRLKEDAINYLKTSLRGGNDEEKFSTQ
jgi:zinc protease